MTTQLKTLDYPIDVNGDLRLILTPDPAHHVIHASIESRYAPTSSKLVKNLLPLIRVSTGSHGMTSSKGEFHNAITPARANFDIPLGPNSKQLSLAINHIPFHLFELNRDQDTISENQDKTHGRKLTVFETRIIGRAPQYKNAPMPLSPLPTSQPLNPFYKPLTHQAPITDLHTHLSAQISSKDLMSLVKTTGGPEDEGKEELLYPTGMLKMLGITPGHGYSKVTPVLQMKRMLFLPTAHMPHNKTPTEPAILLSALTPEAREKLIQAMSLSPEDQCTYEDMEVCYYLREPFTKNVKLLPHILRKIAEDYKQQGVQYAELSTTAVQDPAWLKVIHDAMPQIEKDTGVQLRFLVSIPRNLSDGAIAERVEKYKLIAADPYIVGVDLIGYEMNKTSHLETHLQNLASFIREHNQRTGDDQVLRVHAGENGKNVQNVEQCLDLAEQYGVRLRIGHAVYGISDQVMKRMHALGQRGKLIVEFNPDSNLANNNIDFASEVPVAKFVSAGVPSVLSSDGAGLYRTDAHQTMMAGRFSGLAPEGANFVRALELDHIGHQMTLFSDKRRALAAKHFASGQDYIGALQEAMDKIPKASPSAKAEEILPEQPQQRPAVFDTGRPILIAGAAGSSWDAVSADAQLEARVGLRLLLNHCDPDKVFFVTGRTKNRGIGVELCKAVAEYNAAHPDKPFQCKQMEADSKPVDQLPDGVTYWEKIDKPWLNIPSAMVDSISDPDPERHGIGLFVGGQAFTRDFILKFNQKGIPFGMMNGHGANGASTAKAKIYPGELRSGDAPEASMGHAFPDGIGMFQYMQTYHPEMLSSHPNNNALQLEYEQIKGSLSQSAARSA